jgi:hypothetical protein
MDMKAQFKALAMACVMAAGTIVAAPVFAYHVTPVSTTFIVSGPTSLSVLGVPIPCTSTFTITTDSTGTIVHVTQAVFSGSATCSSVHAVFPAAPNNFWNVTLNSTTSATIGGVSVSTPFGTCSGNVAATVNYNTPPPNTITLNGSLGICSVSGTLTTNPSFSIVNP